MKYLALVSSLGLLFGSACSDDDSFHVDNNTVVRFEDPVFEKQCLLDFDRNGDGVLTVGEISSVQHLDVNTAEIRSLTGIEYFVGLKELVCIPQDSATERGMLEKLNVSRNPELIWLNCCRNRLQRLNMSRNAKLERLYCRENELEELILRNPELVDVDCSNNRLQLLDIRQCSAGIAYCSCAGNPSGMRIRMLWQQAPDFRIDPTVDLYDKQIDGDKILTFADPEFERQVIASSSESVYKGIDFNGDGKVSRNEAAHIKSRYFVCDKISSFEDIRYLCNLNTCYLIVEDRSTCRLRTLDGIYDFPAPGYLSVEDLPITSIDAAKFRNVEILNIFGTDIESLDLSGVSSLKRVDCYRCPAMKEIWLKNRAQEKTLFVTCDEHIRIRYKEDD